MALLQIIIALIIIGVVLYLINRFIPMDSRIKFLLNLLVIVVVIIWLLKAVGVWAWLATVKI